MRCPKRHAMLWLGLCYWLCERGKCGTIYVSRERGFIKDDRGTEGR